MPVFVSPSIKHYKVLEFVKFECQAPPARTQSPPHKRKAPYWRLSGDGSGLTGD